jgi:hypothetical protein
MHYIQTLIDELLVKLDQHKTAEGVPSRMKVLVEELNRLSPLEFLPTARVDFLNIRRELRTWNELPESPWEMLAQHKLSTVSAVDPLLHLAVTRMELHRECGHETQSSSMAYCVLHYSEQLLKKLSAVLDSHRPDLPLKPQREFKFISKPKIQAIVQRDYDELTVKVFPTNAYKSAVVLAGGILEALLIDVISRDVGRMGKAMAWKEAPRKTEKGGTKKVRDLASSDPEEQWSLEKIIAVAVHVGVLRDEDERLIHQALREHRNFIHPHVEVRTGYSIGRPAALSAMGTLEGVIEHIEKNFP